MPRSRLFAVALVLVVAALGAGLWWLLSRAPTSGTGEALASSTGDHETVVRDLTDGAKVAVSGKDHSLGIQWYDPESGGWTAPTILWSDDDRFLHRTKVTVVGGQLAVAQALITDGRTVEPDQEFPSDDWWCTPEGCHSHGFTQVSPHGDHAWSFDGPHLVALWSPGQGVSEMRFADRLDTISLEIHGDGTVTVMAYRRTPSGRCTLGLQVRALGETDLTTVATTEAFGVRAGQPCASFRSYEEYLPADGPLTRVVVHGQGRRSAVFTRTGRGWRASWENTGEGAR
jgi:hypothetical protein